MANRRIKIFRFITEWSFKLFTELFVFLYFFNRIRPLAKIMVLSQLIFILSYFTFKLITSSKNEDDNNKKEIAAMNSANGKMMILPLKDRIFARKFANIQKLISIPEPGNILKFLVFVACFIVMFIQLQECWNKLNDPPIITHTKLTLNETVSYPALTICREPPYNKRFYELFNFTGLHLESYPITYNWNDFPYDTYNISDFWDIAVYNKKVITCYGLSNLLPSDLDLQSSLHFTTGMCHTIRPKKKVSAAGKESGYKIFLLHDLYKYDSLRDKEAGWYIYVHEVKEKFSENINIYSGRQGWVFVPTGEKVEASLDVYQFSSIENCSNDPNYSLTECEEDSWIRDDVLSRTNCSGPWFPKIEKPYCNEPTGMIDLVKATLSMYVANNCPKSCQTTQYKTSVVKRTAYPKLMKLTSSVWIYFSSKAVINVEEKYSYNWNAFIADLGGSIGFLLGLSVIGILGYLERIFQFFIPYLKRNKKC